MKYDAYDLFPTRFMLDIFFRFDKNIPWNLK